jgi:hypothetical protein
LEPFRPWDAIVPDTLQSVSMFGLTTAGALSASRFPAATRAPRLLCEANTRSQNDHRRSGARHLLENFFMKDFD